MNRRYQLKFLMKPPEKKTDDPNVIGGDIPPEYLQNILNRLESRQKDDRMEAIMELLENPPTISYSFADNDEIDEKKFLKAAVESINENRAEIITKLAEKKDEKTLRYIAQSPYVPRKMNDEAWEAVKIINPKAKEEKRPEPLQLRHVPYEEHELQHLVEKFSIPEQQKEAAIEFIENYPAVIEKVTQTPDLSVTEVVELAQQAIEIHSEQIIEEFRQGGESTELRFLSELDFVPVPIREEALKAFEELEGEIVEKVKTEEVERHDTGANDGVAAISAEDLLENLQSEEPDRVVQSVILFYNDYNDVLEEITKSPNVTVTEINDHAVKALENNLDSILENLESNKSYEAIWLIAHSSKVPIDIRLKAKEILRKLERKI